MSLVGLFAAGPAYSQGASAGALPQNAGADFGEDRSTLGLNPEQAKRIANYIDRSVAMNRSAIKNKPSKEELTLRANELISVLHLACVLKNVDLAGELTQTIDGKLFRNSLYEISCEDGIGYFLNSQDRIKKEGAKPDRPKADTSYAISCMSADKLHDDDIKQGKTASEFYCHLSDNGGGDMRAVGQALLTKAGVTCNVTQFKWFGARQDSKTEISEAECDNGQGYLLETALPGNKYQIKATSCADAIRNGLECKMTKVAKPVTLATFKEYLEKSSISCKIKDYDQIALLGKENTKQRYVVEFKCTEQPKGLVAFIPLDGNQNPFETVDCERIKQFGIACKLTLIH
jgi:hypothetical protein